MDSNFIVALSAAIIALAALIVTVWQGVVSRKHNRLSVTPHFRIDYLENPHVSHKYVLRNCGIGPGIITSFEILVDGKVFPEKGWSLYKGVLKLLDLDYDSSTVWYPLEGDALSADEERTILEIHLDDNSRTNEESALKAVPRLSLLIKYKSIYGKKYTVKHPQQ
jgi:hypothetical protein